MELTLAYRGQLKSQADSKTKHGIRQILHRQLKTFCVEAFKGAEYILSRVTKVGGFEFFPLVRGDGTMYAELELTVLRPGPLGGVLAQGGDIDNRLKTLFDALRQPKVLQEIPAGWMQSGEERPLYCLLEDDQLVKKLSIHVDRLLEPGADKNDVLLFVKVNAKGNEIVTYPL
jgi:hypothetical protein